MEYQVEKISRQIKTEKAIRKFIKTIILALLGMLLIINLTMLYQTKVKKEEVLNTYIDLSGTVNEGTINKTVGNVTIMIEE